MCNCINETNDKLAESGQMLNSTMLANPSRAMVSLIRKDKWQLETRRGKPKEILANYCPWCGEKYPALPEKGAV